MSLPESLGAFLAQSRNLILAGNRAGGRPHVTPNWFCWDGARFYVSTTRGRVKYTIFRRDPRAQLLIDDPAGPRAVLIPAAVEVREDLAAELPRFVAIRDKYGMKPLDAGEHLRSLIAEGRVLLAITPDGPPSTWTSWGFSSLSRGPYRVVPVASSLSRRPCRVVPVASSSSRRPYRAAPSCPVVSLIQLATIYVRR